MNEIQKKESFGTGLVKATHQEESPVKFGELVQKYQFGGISLTKEQAEILYKEFEDDEIEIRPDGLIYVPWFRYVERLREAGLRFAFIPEGRPHYVSEANLVIWGFWLILEDRVCGFAYGEAQYHPENARMSYGDAIEAAKSNAIMRLCKDIGIVSLKIWDPDFVEEWKRKYAVVETDEKGRKVWRKRKRPIERTIEKPVEKTGSAEANGGKSREIFASMIKTHFLNPEDWVKLIERVCSFKTLTNDQVNDAVLWIRERTKDRTKTSLYQNALRWRQHYIDRASELPDFFDKDVQIPSEGMTIEELKNYIDKLRNELYSFELQKAISIIMGANDDSGEDN